MARNTEILVSNNQINNKLVAELAHELNKQALDISRKNQTAAIVDSQPTTGCGRILDKMAEELVSVLAEGYKREDYTVTSAEVKIPIYLEYNLPLEFEKLKLYGMISRYVYARPECWEVNILPCLLTYFEDKERAVMQSSNNTNIILGNATNVQIQQGTVNSIQKQSNNCEVDYDKAQKIVEAFNKYDVILDSEFGEKAAELRDNIKELKELVVKKDEPSKTNTILNVIKDLLISVNGSLIASGILALF